ncbi:hypothetical protein Bbelb_269720 [Branchiostoma belcheri]|nr:hypothetical protein Bbelb_269720 [Branchiostoma belcheri]
MTQVRDSRQHSYRQPTQKLSEKKSKPRTQEQASASLTSATKTSPPVPGRRCFRGASAGPAEVTAVAIVLDSTQLESSWKPPNCWIRQEDTDTQTEDQCCKTWEGWEGTPGTSTSLQAGVAEASNDRNVRCSSGKFFINLTREDWTRSGDLKTDDDSQKPVMTVDFCVNQTRSGVCTCPCRCVLRVGCLFWEKPVDLKKEMKTAGTVVIVDPRTGLQQEGEPDFVGRAA